MLCWWLEVGDNEEAGDGNSKAAARTGRDAGSERRSDSNVPQETSRGCQPAH